MASKYTYTENFIFMLGDNRDEEVKLPYQDLEKVQSSLEHVPIENDKIKVTKKGKIKTTKIGYFFDCQKIV